MSTNTGIWIDKKHAFVVKLENGNEKLDIIESDIDFRIRFEGEKPPVSKFGNQFINNDKGKEVHLKKQLKDYYEKIIEKLIDANQIYIFGPADAKIELNKEIVKRNDMASKVKAIETSDKLTENQIIATVKKYFSN